MGNAERERGERSWERLIGSFICDVTAQNVPNAAMSKTVFFRIFAMHIRMVWKNIITWIFRWF